VCGAIKITLGHKTRKDTQLKLYETLKMPYLMGDSKTWIARRRDGRRLEATDMRFIRFVMGHTGQEKE
jgi:hypothetical protein